ncbi:MAG: T9SS type A sorting domain-containing protein [Draconibacterium sp.]|nr:T9SS type A sorting domain-containing protein [Draconibacterium sp.]
MYDWDGDNSKWVETEKIEYPYDAHGNQTIDIVYEWDTENSEWIKYEMTERRYDANGNMSQESHSVWEQSASSWMNSTREEYLCNSSYNLSDLILPPDNEIYDNQIHMVTKVKYYSWDSSSNNWDFGGDAIAYYSEHDMTIATELNGASIRIYPNPASDFVTIDIQQISNPVQFELFDIQGHEIMSREIMNTENINLKGISEGLYFYNLSSGKEKVSGKLIKQ